MQRAYERPPIHTTHFLKVSIPQSFIMLKCPISQNFEMNVYRSHYVVLAAAGHFECVKIQMDWSQVAVHQQQFSPPSNRSVNQLSLHLQKHLSSVLFPSISTFIICRYIVTSQGYSSWKLHSLLYYQLSSLLCVIYFPYFQQQASMDLAVQTKSQMNVQLIIITHLFAQTFYVPVFVNSNLESFQH